MTQYFFAYTGRLETAEELSQDAWAQIFRSIQTYDNDLAPATRIHYAKRWTLRKGIRQARRSLDRENGNLVEDAVKIEPWYMHALDPERALLHKQEALHWLMKLRGASGLRRRIFWMHVFRDMSYEEISEQTGRTLGGIEKAMRMAQKTLGRPVEGKRQIRETPHRKK